MIKFNGYDLRDIGIANLLDNLTRGLSEQENNLDNLIRLANSAISIEEPDYRILAANLFYNEIKNEFNQFKKENNINTYYDYLKYMVNNKYYDKKILEVYRKQDIDLISELIDEKYNYDYDYAGMNILRERYLATDKLKNVIETPEYMYMTISLLIASVEKNEERLNKAKQIYEATHSRKISLATPILLNLRKISGNLSSCFIVSVSDSLLSINYTMGEINLISQKAGGVGLNIGRIRAEGSMINRTPNASSGVMSWVKIADSNITAVNQESKRKGSLTVALPIWHYDFEDFLHCQTENGDLRKKAFNIFPQVIIPDLFMECVKKDAYWNMFCPYEVKKELNIEINELTGKDFYEAYANIVENPNIRKKRVKAKELYKSILKVQLETGLPYIFFTDTVNEVNPNIHEGIIENGNLCVVGDTKILTKDGYKEIQQLEGQEVELWNGEEWSLSPVFKTGKNKKIIEVYFNNGQFIECTEYHKFPIIKGDARHNKYDLVYAKDLKLGDKLIKHKLPIIEGKLELVDAYTNGFYSGDGSLQANGNPEISLYGEKIKLIDKLNTRIVGKYQENNDKVRVLLYKENIKEKFFVPDSSYTIKSRLEWLAGIFDSDGCLLTEEKNRSETIQVSSINKDFLKDIQLMLQTLGINSKIVNLYPERKALMPDGKGSKKLYNCKQIFRLIISTYGVYQLKDLGLKTFRLNIIGLKPQRNSERFIKITNIVDNNKNADTYCFTEPKRHLGMFNGVLLSQCMESYSPFKASKVESKPYLTYGTSIRQDITTGYAHTCNLVSPNLALVNNDLELEETIALSVNILDNTIELSEAPIPESQLHNDLFRIIGVGSLGLADWLAKNKLTYKTGLKQISELFEKIAYYGIKESVRLAKNRCTYPLFDGSEWSKGRVFGKDKGWFESHETVIDKKDWIQLLSDMERYGIRNGGLFAIAPTTSSSLLVGATASILPPFSKMFTDKNSKGVVTITPPHLSKDTMWYYQENKNIDQKIVIDAISAIQEWVDQGISGELLLNIRDGFVAKAKDFYDLIMYAHEKKMKTVYYVRQIKPDTESISNNSDCVSCAN